jgi:hypothetical protein
MACCHSAAMTATRIGVPPMIKDACVTLVRATPTFCTATEQP